MGGLHCQADQKGRKEIRALDGRLAGRRQAVQGRPEELQEAEPGRSFAEGQEDEGRGVRDTSLATIIILGHILKSICDKIS